MRKSISKIRKIGNSQGIIFPKAILEDLDFNSGVVSMVIKDSALIITPVRENKKKWSDFILAEKQSADFVPNNFDKSDWTW